MYGISTLQLRIQKKISIVIILLSTRNYSSKYNWCKLCPNVHMSTVRGEESTHARTFALLSNVDYSREQTLPILSSYIPTWPMNHVFLKRELQQSASQRSHRAGQTRREMTLLLTYVAIHSV